MRNRAQSLWIVAVVLTLVAVAPAAAGQPKPAVRSTAKNTLKIDHLALDSKSEALYVLEVRDGEYFQILFDNSYPECFEYSISATDDARVENTSQTPGRAIEVSRKDLKRGRVTMQHREAFTKYRIKAKLICAVEAGAPNAATLEDTQDTKTKILGIKGDVQTLDLSFLLPDRVALRELAFDLFVLTTPGWGVSINGGVGFQNFKSPNYFIKSTTVNGTTVKTFEEAESDEHSRPAIMTLVSVTPPVRGWPRQLGASVGFGGQGGDLRYYFGGSVSLGGHVVFSAGRAFGFVNAKPLGQDIGAAPVSDNVLANVRSVPQSSWYFGFALGFDVKSKPDTIAAFATSSTSKPPALTATSAFTGTYATDSNVLTVTSDGVGITVLTNTATLTFPVRKENTFSDVSGAQSATFEIAADKKTASSVTLKLTAGELKAERARSLDDFVGKYGNQASPHSIALDGTGLLISTPGGEAVRFVRKGNLTFSDGTRTATFKVTEGKVASLELSGASHKKIE